MYFRNEILANAVPISMQKTNPKHAIALMASPGMGHLIPMAELAGRLVRHHGFEVTLITHSTGPLSQPELTLLNSIPNEVSIISLPPPPSNLIPADVDVGAVIIFTINYNLPRIGAILSSLLDAESPLAAVVIDLFGVGLFGMAEEISVPPYLLFTTSCMMLSFCFYFPTLEATIQGEYKDQSDPLRLPGCTPLQGRDFTDPLHHGRSSEAHKGAIWLFKMLPKAKGVLVNSFYELEAEAIKAIEEDNGLPPIYPIGPLTRTLSMTAGDAAQPECLKWLDEQPKGSVLYVSFGSGGALSVEQTKELALGLEMSRHRFLWIAKCPNDDDAAATFFSIQSKTDPFCFLQEGFLQRTKKTGFVVSSWVPQLEVLRHGAVGGFLTHCGWNSTLESIVNGVPLIAWPLYAEQGTNAAMLVDGVKVAVRPKANEKGVVWREEVSRVVKCIMEGEEGQTFRARAQALADDAARALEEGGSSARSMAEVVKVWKSSSRE